MKSRKRSLERLVLPALVPLLALALLAGCSSGSGTATSGVITLTDDAGNTVTLDGPADRVVSLAPANTEIIYALGGGDKLVGVTTYCDYPPAAKKKVKIGDFQTPNVERIASVGAQVVFATGGIQENITDSLEKLDIKVFVVDPRTIDRMFTDMESMGKIMGLEGEAKEQVEKLRERVAAVKEKVKAEGLAKKPTVFFEVFNQPLMTAGKGTLIDSMIKTTGGTNVGASAGTDFPQYSDEQLITDNPDIFIAVKGSQSNPEDIAKRPGYSQMKAVKDGRVFVVEDNLFVRPGPRLVQGLEQLARMVQPEAFEEKD